MSAHYILVYSVVIICNFAPFSPQATIMLLAIHWQLLFHSFPNRALERMNVVSLFSLLFETLFKAWNRSWTMAVVAVAIERNALDRENALESAVHGEIRPLGENVLVAGNASIGSAHVNVDTMMIVTERKNATENDTRKEIVATDIRRSLISYYICSPAVQIILSSQRINSSCKSSLTLSSTSSYPSRHLCTTTTISHTCSNL